MNLTAKVGEPIHQFGVNAFRLYGLPSPKPGAVVGLIGRNGIGKSTSLKVLTGQILPNQGREEEPEGYKDILLKFRGKELQAFFEKLSSGKLSFSYKPQNVDDIPKHFKGKVRALLEKTGSKEKLEALAKDTDQISNMQKCGKVLLQNFGRNGTLAEYINKQSN